MILGTIASGISGHLFAPSGAFDALATVTVPSGGSAAITFAGIPSTYSRLQIRSITKGTGAEDSILMTFNGDTGNNYTYHGLYGTGSGAAGTEGGGPRANIPLEQRAVASSATGVFAGGIMNIIDYASISKNKTTRNLAGYDNGSAGFVAMGTGSWMATAPITSITFTTAATSFAQYTTFSLYGAR